MEKPLHAIGAAIGNSAGIAGCEEGPATIEHSLFLKHLPLTWQAHCHENDFNSLPEFCHALAHETATCLKNNARFLVIGGDHSCAMGTWNGAAHALPAKHSMGLIWIDAHLDAHTPETSISGNYHGMPVAHLLGYGNDALTKVGHANPALTPDKLVMIGIRSYEPEEKALIKSLGIRVYYIEEVLTRGIDTVLNEALAHVTQAADHFGLSIDIDAIDPADVPGVGTPEEQGIPGNDFLTALAQHHCLANKQCIGAEIAEFNPSLDDTDKTERFTTRLISALF